MDPHARPSPARQTGQRNAAVVETFGTLHGKSDRPGQTMVQNGRTWRFI
jgi:hypothetical protein